MKCERCKVDSALYKVNNDLWNFNDKHHLFLKAYTMNLCDSCIQKLKARLNTFFLESDDKNGN